MVQQVIDRPVRIIPRVIFPSPVPVPQSKPKSEVPKKYPHCPRCGGRIFGEKNEYDCVSCGAQYDIIRVAEIIKKGL